MKPTTGFSVTSSILTRFWFFVVTAYDFYRAYYFLLDCPPCPDCILIVGWWLSSPQTEAKETLYFLPIELRFYSRPVLVSILLVPTRPDPPPPPSPYSHVSVLLSLINSSRNYPTLPPPGTVRLCSPLPLAPLRLRLVLGIPAPLVAMNLH